MKNFKLLIILSLIVAIKTNAEAIDYPGTVASTGSCIVAGVGAFPCSADYVSCPTPNTENSPCTVQGVSGSVDVPNQYPQMPEVISVQDPNGNVYTGKEAQALFEKLVPKSCK